MEKQEFEKMEQEHKDFIYNQFYEVSKRLSTEINQVNEITQLIFFSQEIIPNVAITANNKVVELSNIFKKAGLSMFAATEVKQSSGEEDFEQSFIGSAIMMDLLEKLVDAGNEIIEYSYIIKDEFKEILSTSLKQASMMRKGGPIKKYLNHLKDYFLEDYYFGKEYLDVGDFFTEEEEEELINKLQKYKEMDKKIWDYDLKDNIIPVIVKRLREYEYKISDIPELLKKEIIPDLEKLGLADTVPELKKAIKKEYKKEYQVYKDAERLKKACNRAKKILNQGSSTGTKTDNDIKSGKTKLEKEDAERE